MKVATGLAVTGVALAEPLVTAHKASVPPRVEEGQQQGAEASRALVRKQHRAPGANSEECA